MNDQFIVEEFERQFKEISEKYRGIRREDLDELNPWYSCVLCSANCEYRDRKDRVNFFCDCGHNITLATEEEFALRYSFDY